jgi:RimJ/RimL family protein N-acetyltransferase
MQIFLETDRLVLRRFTDDDVDNLVDLDSDPDVMHFINGGRPTPREEIQDDVLPAFLGYYERFAGYGFWAAVEKSTGDFLGWFHFRPPEGRSLDDVELGYRLRKSAWRKGYATEASRALIHKGFTELGVQRVFAETMAVNVASRRVMEKAGVTGRCRELSRACRGGACARPFLRCPGRTSPIRRRSGPPRRSIPAGRRP